MFESNLSILSQPGIKNSDLLYRLLSAGPRKLSARPVEAQLAAFLKGPANTVHSHCPPEGTDHFSSSHTCATK